MIILLNLWLVVNQQNNQTIDSVIYTLKKMWRFGGQRISRHSCAYRKNAVQVSPYGSRLFICQTSRCVCQCGPASALEHHPLCGRQATSPGEYDILDGPPNHRTGHGHGSYLATVRQSPAMLRLAPATQSSSHALWLVCSLFWNQLCTWQYI